MTVALISHPNCREHQMGAHHPECAQRLDAIHDRLIASGLDMLLRHHDAPLATYDQLTRVHDPDYIKELQTRVPDHENGLNWVDSDTALSHRTWPAALRSAGAAVKGVDLVLSNAHDAAFCCTRPPGHHAERHRAMGFCFLNNTAIAAAHALDRYALTRIVVVDFDVHHGNGTENIFKGDERILFCNSFQHPFYPGTGADTNAPNIVNIPLPAGTGGAEFRTAVENKWLPRIDAFRPQLVVISAGFDGHAEDEMAQFNLRETDYAWITRQLHILAVEHADNRIVSCLEGGYNLSALGRSVSTHIAELFGHP